jgi:signal transduction histidine kinase
VNGPISNRRRGSLAYRLPLLIIALLAILVAGGAALAYTEVRTTAMQAWSERLTRISSQLASVVEAGAAERLGQVRQIANAPSIVDFLSGRGTSYAALSVLQSGVVADDLPLEVLRRDGRAALRAGSMPDLGPEQLDSLRAAVPLQDSGGIGSIVSVAGQRFLWITAPVTRGNAIIGHVAHLRPVFTGEPERLIDFFGAGAIYMVDGSGTWLRLDGVEVEPAPGTASGMYVRDGVEVMMRRALVPNSQLWMVAEVPMERVLAQSKAFLRNLLAGSVMLMLLGAAGAWLLSIGIVRPIRELSTAAADIAAGDYTRRVAEERTDEIGTLARAFNSMAAEVDRSREALREKLAEARRLAGELEESNKQFVEAMSDAERLRAEAESANQAKSRFLATMSHEIRTPINAIIGYTDLMTLEIPGSLTAVQRRHLERIRASGQHLMRLVDEVLDLARIESGRLQVHARLGSAREAIQAAANVVEPDAQAKDITLVLPPADEPDVWYHGDPLRVGQVLINLMANAVKFTPEGGSIAVSVRAMRGEDAQQWACMAVRDTGVGIEDEQVEQLFDAFVQGDSGYTRTHGGVGLGLAISRQLARLMGGDIDVSSEPGAGSTFMLRLPLAAHQDATHDMAAGYGNEATG